LGIDQVTAYGHVQKGIRNLERAMRSPEPAEEPDQSNGF
jgi:hypothetical protein